MVELLIKINTLLGNFDSIVGSLGLLIGVVGCIVGIVGKKELNKANEINIKIKEFDSFKSRIKHLESSNSQFAQTINNNGLGYKDTQDIAKNIVNEATKNIPNEIYSDKEPTEEAQALGDYWRQEY